MRWQIELMFKLWKSGGGELERWQSEKPWAMLCELYAKLIGLVLMHWEVLVSGWKNEKLSLWKAVRVARSYLVSLIKLGQAGAEAAIVTLLTEMQWQLQSCKLDSHQKYPSSYQRLAASASPTAPLLQGAILN